MIVSAAPKAAHRKSTRRPKSTQIDSATADNLPSSGPASIVALQPKYTCQIPISKSRQKDLMDLCNSKVIDADYRSWYEALPVAVGIIDKLPLPDVDEKAAMKTDCYFITEHFETTTFYCLYFELSLKC